MTLKHWSPVTEMRSFERNVNDLLKGFFGDSTSPLAKSVLGETNINEQSWRPRTDIIEAEDHYHLSTDLPGIDPKDVKITVEEGRLTLSGERVFSEESQDTNWQRRERRYGKFERSFVLPDTIDQEAIKAEFKNGQLDITIPKLAKVQPKQIEISID